jgi:pimeloyl-ACP methyl ester carboxylesterase
MDRARIGDVEIRYATNGSGTPLVLLHGFTDQIESWREMGYVEATLPVPRRR